MKGFQRTIVSWLAGGLALGLLLTLGQPARSQPPPSQDNRALYLPPAYGATPLSTVINSQASWIASYGYYLESAAMARKINAEAVALEIENAVRYVEAYFERRQINKEARAPDRNYLLREAKRQEVVKKRIETQFQDLLDEADLSDRLNWLLTELSGPVMACHYLSQTDRQGLAEFDQPLPPGALDQVWFTDGGKKGSQLLLQAGKGEVLSTDWPPGLRGNDPEELDAARLHFEQARDRALQEARGPEGQVSDPTGKELLQAVNELFVALEAAYPKQRRADPAEFLAYNAAHHYLQSLLAQVNRVRTTSDALVFDRSLAFKGKTVLELLQHMYQTGMVFASPQPGGERVYRNLIENMRNVYLSLGEIGQVAPNPPGPPRPNGS